MPGNLKTNPDGLRRLANMWKAGGYHCGEVIADAADHIEALESERDALRDQLSASMRHVEALTFDQEQFLDQIKKLIAQNRLSHAQ